MGRGSAPTVSTGVPCPVETVPATIIALTAPASRPPSAPAAAATPASAVRPAVVRASRRFARRLSPLLPAVDTPVSHPDWHHHRPSRPLRHHSRRHTHRIHVHLHLRRHVWQRSVACRWILTVLVWPIHHRHSWIEGHRSPIVRRSSARSTVWRARTSAATAAVQIPRHRSSLTTLPALASTKGGSYTFKTRACDPNATITARTFGASHQIACDRHLPDWNSIGIQHPPHLRMRLLQPKTVNPAPFGFADCPHQTLCRHPPDHRAAAAAAAAATAEVAAAVSRTRFHRRLGAAAGPYPKIDPTAHCLDPFPDERAFSGGCLARLLFSKRSEPSRATECWV
jgi:hypothetical protein